MRTQVNKEAAKVLSRYQPFFQNDIALLAEAKKGLSPEAVFDFISIADLPSQRIETVLNKSMKTFQNYKDKNTGLDAVTSEKLLKLFALYNEGVVVFGSIDAFVEWLARPAYGLGNQVPEDLMDTMTGVVLIHDELKRIAYGDLG
ncbi:MAG: DUF2384 domain-containing protein [Flavisolibacter sp.]|nr:DUF2384 domain-containing protein [Flavisolibacter sp.]